MMESLEEAGSCSKYDSRGVLWTGKYGMSTKKSCSLTLGPLYAGSLVEIEQEAFWFCDETLRDFDSPEPDRSGCTDPWIDNLNDNMLSSLSTGEISDGFILESPAFGVIGGSLWKLGDFLPVLLEEDTAKTDTPTDAPTTTTTTSTTTIKPTTTTTRPTLSNLPMNTRTITTTTTTISTTTTYNYATLTYPTPPPTTPTTVLLEEDTATTDAPTDATTDTPTDAPTTTTTTQ